MIAPPQRDPPNPSQMTLFQFVVIPSRQFSPGRMFETLGSAAGAVVWNWAQGLRRDGGRSQRRRLLC